MTKAPVQSTSTEIARLPAHAVNIMDKLGIRLADPAEVQWEIAERLALAQTPEELFGDNGPLGLREHLGRRFLIRQVRYMPGQFDEGAGFYALINAVDADTNAPVVFTSGALNVLIQLARAEQMGWLDQPVTAREADTPTANGYKPYRLVWS